MCRVLKTKWPVNAAFNPISTVSLSLISPTKIISGSCRKNDLRADANDKPISSLIWTWPTPSNSYSTGSSAVKIFKCGLLTSLSILYSVVDFPEPVGPVTKISPWVLWIAFLKFFKSTSSKFNCSRVMSPASLFKIRITILSLFAVGRIDKRRSTTFPSILKFIAPSCGNLLSAISNLPIILNRVTTAP